LLTLRFRRAALLGQFWRGCGRRAALLGQLMTQPSEAAPSHGYRFCPNCGTEAVGAGSFCSECGGLLIKTGVQPSVVATASHQAAAAVPQAFPPPPGVRGLGLTSTLGSYGPAPSYVTSTTAPPSCPRCGEPWQGTHTCGRCGQVWGCPVGVQISSPGRRLAAFLLENLFFWLTLGIGYIIWSFCIFGRGQNPGKQVLGMRVVRLERKASSTWWWTFFRTVVENGLLLILFVIFFPLGIVACLWLLWDKDNQELWDKICGTVVVDDPSWLTKPAR